MADIVLELSGPLTLDTAMKELARSRSAFAQQAKSAQAAHPQGLRVVADLSGVTEVDTSALAVLIEIARDTSQVSNRPLGLRSAPESLASLARLTSLTKIFDWEQMR